MFKKIVVLILINSFLLALVCYAEPSASAQSYIVMDSCSNIVLYSKNSNMHMGMASTTKIMTAILALEYGNPDDIVKISVKADNEEGSSMYISAGENIKLCDLVYGLMLVSGNDAAIAIAEHISGSSEKFAELMNEKAAKIGALNTHFVNPNGLSDDNHYTTAYDLALITSYCMKNNDFCDIVKTKKKVVSPINSKRKIHLKNHNKLLTICDGCVGVKTGFTKATGRCLVSAVKRNNMKFICVTLKASDDWNDHINLYKYAFKNFEKQKILVSDRAVKDSLPISLKDIKYNVPDEIYIPVTENQKKNLSAICIINKDLKIPIKKHQLLGYITVFSDKKTIAKFEINAEEEVLQKNIVLDTINSKLLKNYIYMMKKLFGV